MYLSGILLQVTLPKNENKKQSRLLNMSHEYVLNAPGGSSHLDAATEQVRDEEQGKGEGDGGPRQEGRKGQKED
ncbi:hypothetical protein E2C01_072582 [Portunus trituberculatus]|uniref:Uncharacterized protein n=1 Tax=Portunus trituberculatus TaxID=210409 RepID=A0A5B7IBQ4_PORTR|nr:hypothetical protein [Portunus trituberculatus]